MVYDPAVATLTIQRKRARIDPRIFSPFDANLISFTVVIILI